MGGFTNSTIDATSTKKTNKKGGMGNTLSMENSAARRTKRDRNFKQLNNTSDNLHTNDINLVKS